MSNLEFGDQFSFDKINKSRKENILKSFHSNLDNIQPSDIDQEISKAIELEVIEKGGKRAVIGEFREWSGKKYQKTTQGWIAVKGEKSEKKEEVKSKENKNKFEYGDKVYVKHPTTKKLHIAEYKGQSPDDSKQHHRVTIKQGPSGSIPIHEKDIYHRDHVTRDENGKLWIKDKKEDSKPKEEKKEEKSGVFERGDEIEVGKYKMSVVGYNEDGQLKVMNKQNEKFTLSKEKTKELEAKQYPKEDSKPKEEKKDVPKELSAFLDQFPNNADKWSQATGELVDLANYIDQETGENTGSKERSKSPSEYNTKNKKRIQEGWNKLNEKQKQQVLDHFELKKEKKSIDKTHADKHSVNEQNNSVRKIVGNKYNDAMINSIKESLLASDFDSSDLKVKHNGTQDGEANAIDQKVNNLFVELRPGMEHKDLTEAGIKDILYGMLVSYNNYNGDSKFTLD